MNDESHAHAISLFQFPRTFYRERREMPMSIDGLDLDPLFPRIRGQIFSQLRGEHRPFPPKNCAAVDPFRPRDPWAKFTLPLCLGCWGEQWAGVENGGCRRRSLPPPSIADG